MSLSIDIVTSSHAPRPLAEAAAVLATALGDAGVEASLVRDQLPAAEAGRPLVVVGPHEVLPRLAATDDELAGALGRAVLVGTARPGTAAWDAGLPYLDLAAVALDVTAHGPALLAARGVRAERFRWGYHASLDRWGGGTAPRPLDVVFLGRATARRERVIASVAEVLARHEVDLRLTGGGPAPGHTASGMLSSAERLSLLGRARVLLGVHAGQDRSFSWLRAVEAIANGCVIVTEEVEGMAPLEPGRHAVSGTAASLPLLLDVVLDDAERLEAVRRDAYAFLRTELPLERAASRLAELAADAAARPRRRASVASPRLAASRVAASAEPSAGEPEPGPAGEVAAAMERQNAVLKRLFFDLRLLRRQIGHIAHAVESPHAPLVERLTTPAAETTQPDVSVVIPVHNYARFVTDALRSVLRTQEVSVEVIVVDDASIDESAHVVRAFMADHPELPITFFQQRVNTGVQRSRNLAFGHARAPYAFVLDADNTVYPRGIAKLRRALDADPGAAFAFGLIERFGEQGPVGLMGTQGWDPVLLAQGHYIDAMALVRVEAWRQVGGYVVDPLLELGWEDYDLWLSFAAAGMHAVHVREIVGRYRLHGVSSLTITSLDTAGLMSMLRQRHAGFFAAAEAIEAS